LLPYTCGQLSGWSNGVVSRAAFLKKVFKNLIELVDDSDDDQAIEIYDKQKSIGNEIDIKTTENVRWEASNVEGYSEWPTVEQNIIVIFGGIRVAKFSRYFGTEFTRADMWQAMLLDYNNDFGQSIDLTLEAIGIEIDYPDIPPPRPC
jgi:hypothetical protein